MPAPKAAPAPTIGPGALSALLEDLVRGPDPGSSWDRALRPGVVIGRFELVRELGRGGFGVVYEARDRELGRAVALKAVRAGDRLDLREERLLREAEAAARLSHPNLVTLFDVGRCEHGPYLVLELLRGETLAQRLAQGPMPVREALRVGATVARGLAHAHAAGVVHRDLTPGNVFLCQDGQVKVLDLGLAHAFGRRRIDGGTPGFMSPEQRRGAPEDERTDVFALGAILYRMLAGEPPFSEESPHRPQDPTPAFDVPEVPALGPLVGRMLALDPVARPRDAGEVAAALDVFERELGREPAPTASPVVRRPRRRAVPRPTNPAPVGGATEVLLEREAQLAELTSLLESARAGEGRVALVYGEAGIGKTALVRHFTRAHARDVRVLWGACDPLSTPRPLAPLLDLASTDAGGLAARLRAGTPRVELFHGLFEELRSPTRPAILVFEDLHWADEATLDLVRFLGRRAERTSALLVFTWRDDGIGADHPLRAALGDVPHAVVGRVPLGGLSPDAVQRLGARARRSTEGLHAATSGNPFFVTEVLATDAPGIPESVRDAVLARVARLPPRVRALCELAAIVPARVPLTLLEAAAGPGFAALDDLLASGVVSVQGGAVAFRHELARRAIEDALPPLRRRELHACVLAVLRARGEDAAQLALLLHHASGAGDAAAVLRLAPPAAEHASRLGAHREAEAHLALALRHADALPPRRRAELLEAHAYECYLTDRMPEAIASCAAACGLWRDVGDRAREGNALCWLARIQWYAARTDEARRNADRAIELLEALPPGRDLGMAWVTRGALHALADDGAAAVPLLEKALQLGRSTSEREVEAHALDLLGCARIQLGDDGGWELLEESVRFSLAEGLQDAAGRAYANLGSLAVEERRHALAASVLDEGIAWAAERDLRTRAICMHSWRARLRVETGRWVEAAEDARRILENPNSFAMFRLAALTALALLRTRRGDPGAREALEEAWSLARENGELERLVPVASARAEHLWLGGDARGATDAAAEVIERARRARRPWYVGDLAVWIWRGGGAAPPPDECARPVVLQLRGDWRGAAEEYERLGCPYQAALATFESDDPGALLGGLETLERLGARPAAARLRRRLSELGVRGVPRGPRAARRERPFDPTARRPGAGTRSAPGRRARQRKKE